MKKILTAILLFAFLNIANAQTSDTSVLVHLKPDINDKSWGVSFNAGMQKRFFFGAGIARTNFIGSNHGVYGSDIYAGVNIFPAFKKIYEPVTGIKLGGDLFGNAFFIGTEIQYLKSKGVEDWLFTPGPVLVSVIYTWRMDTASQKINSPLQALAKTHFRCRYSFPFIQKIN